MTVSWIVTDLERDLASPELKWLPSRLRSPRELARLLGEVITVEAVEPDVTATRGSPTVAEAERGASWLTSARETL